jgi:hypothetical protein
MIFPFGIDRLVVGLVGLLVLSQISFWNKLALCFSFSRVMPLIVCLSKILVAGDHKTTRFIKVMNTSS